MFVDLPLRRDCAADLDLDAGFFDLVVFWRRIGPSIYYLLRLVLEFDVFCFNFQVV